MKFLCASFWFRLCQGLASSTLFEAADGEYLPVAVQKEVASHLECAKDKELIFAKKEFIVHAARVL